MRSIVNGMLVALLLATVTAGTTFAKGKRSTVTFTADTKVNDVLVKKGTYQVVFNEEAGELTILKDRKPIAKTSAQAVDREGRRRNLEVYTFTENSEIKFVGIAFEGSNQKLIVNQSGMAAADSN